MKKCQPRALTPFLDGELTEDAWQETEEHLQSCPSCSAQLDELTAASQHVRAMGRATIPQSALKAAVDIIASRVGLTPEAMLAETTEIARARAAEPPVPPLPGALGPSAPVTDDFAWTPMPAPSEPVMDEPEIAMETAMEAPETAIEAPETAMEAPETTAEAPETAIEAPETAMKAPETQPAPTWVQPEKWGQPDGLDPAGAMPDAPAAAMPEPPAPEASVGSVSHAPLVEPPPEPVAEVEQVDAMPILEEHPPSPPSPIVPSWIDDLPMSETELEMEGRQAVDDAIGPPAAEAHEAVAPPDDATELPLGPTSAADAELREAEASPAADTGVGEETSGRFSPWSRLSALLSRRGHGDPAPIETEAGSAIEAEPPAEATPPAVEAELSEQPVDAAPAETFDRPEAERLMWIEPRRSAEIEVPDEPGVADPESEPDIESDRGLVTELDTGLVTTLDAELETELDMQPDTELGAEPADDEDPSNLSGYRQALLGARVAPAPRRRPLLPPALGARLGLAAAALVIVLAAGALFVSRSIHPSSTAATGSPSSQSSARTQPTASPAPTPVPSTAASSSIGQLTEVVSAGSGGTGWTVSRIRLGSPGNGITRVVLDLTGSGATPTAQLGRGADGAIYLTVPGMSIAPSIVTGAAPGGAITGISPAGTDGISLRFATNGSPGFSIGYLPSPYRLVLDFK